MSYTKEKVLSVTHWNDRLFSFTCTRPQSFRFTSGMFVMIGLMVEGKPLLRAYSVASPSWDETLEFYSIHVENGPLTSRLNKIQVGDEVLLGTKPVGTLLMNNLLPGKNLWCLATGTGLAPFMSVMRDPEILDAYDKIIVTHTNRYHSEFAYQEYIRNELPNHEYLGELVREKLVYIPTVTRELQPRFVSGRITDLLKQQDFYKLYNLDQINIHNDRVMICGNPDMVHELADWFEEKGWKMGSASSPGHFVIENAFVDR